MAGSTAMLHPRAERFDFIHVRERGECRCKGGVIIDCDFVGRLVL